jgi:integrative and conjugative element protein (TIGR02256 family)
MRFARPQGGIFSVSSSALDLLYQFKQVDPSDPERGGVLLGRLIVDSDDVVVDEITTPGPNDKWGRYFFRRSRNDTQKRIVDAWNESGHTRHYLGEWHTHPEALPQPSCKDRCNWRRIAKKAVYEQDALFFLIVGQSSIAAWEVDRKTREITQLDKA